ncbi:hypothetical protein HPB50_013590 [Hyalomma asiaticum]|uniref:Uncharacterized protein n=1 Tax=Hyalomma asiaticum TaxID=266040 RepID=A0ACB7RUD8_HYAAI|nr:hypothetical protein HPB50_013590 [Hyalomma asiaticum]
MSVDFPPALGQGSSEYLSGPTMVAWGIALPSALESSSQDALPDPQLPLNTAKGHPGLAGDALLLVVSDIEASQRYWGYRHANTQGKKLWALVQDLRLASQQSMRNASLDLTLGRNVMHGTWDNTGTLAGSDRYIITIAINTS